MQNKVTLPYTNEMSDEKTDYCRLGNYLCNLLHNNNIPEVKPHEKCLNSTDHLIVLVTPEGKKLRGEKKKGGTPIFIQMVEVMNESEIDGEAPPNVFYVKKADDIPTMIESVNTPENCFRFLQHVRKVLALEPQPIVGWVKVLMKKRGMEFEDSSSDEEEE